MLHWVYNSGSRVYVNRPVVRLQFVYRGAEGLDQHKHCEINFILVQLFMLLILPLWLVNVVESHYYQVQYNIVYNDSKNTVW